MELTTNQVIALAEQQRDMCPGVTPYVVLNGDRAAMTPEVMEHFKLEVGQQITTPIMIAILEFNLNHCKTMIAEQEATKAIEKMISS